MSDAQNGKVYVFSKTSLCLTITGFSEPFGMDVDSKGNVWVADLAASQVFQFAPPYSGPPAKTIADPGFQPSDVAVCKGYVAIANVNSTSYGSGNVMIFRDGHTTMLQDPNIPHETRATCDPQGNLFTDGADDGNLEHVNEWKLGKSPPIELRKIPLGAVVPAGLDWEGDSLWVLDVQDRTITEWPAPFKKPSRFIILNGAAAPTAMKVDAKDKLVAVADLFQSEGIVYTLTGAQKYTLNVPYSAPAGITWNHDYQ